MVPSIEREGRRDISNIFKSLYVIEIRVSLSLRFVTFRFVAFTIFYKAKLFNFGMKCFRKVREFTSLSPGGDGIIRHARKKTNQNECFPLRNGQDVVTMLSW